MNGRGTRQPGGLDKSPSALGDATSRLWRVYLGLGAAWVGLYFLTNDSTAQEILYPVTGFVSGVSILVGIRLNRPARQSPWVLLAAGVLLWAVGDTIWSGYSLILHTKAPWPSAADYIYLAGPLFMAIGLTQMLRQRSPGGDVDGLVDALIVAVGLGTLSWIFLMAPYAADASLHWFTKVVAVAFPFADIVLLVVVLRLLFAPGAHTASHRLLAGALTLTLLCDIVHAFMALAGAYHIGHPVDAGWLFFYLFMGAAALHPSMSSVATPVDQEPRRPSRKRFALLVAAVSLAPCAMLLQLARGEVVDAPTIAAACLVSLLVVLRMERLVRDVYRGITRLRSQESALRNSLDDCNELEARLRHQALHDPLTGLPNRVLFRDRLDQAIRHSARTAEPLAVMFLDLDDFKIVNDTMGHEAGDRLLVEVGNRLQDLVRGSDTPSRLGGDEFAILLDRMADPDDARVVGARVLDAMCHPFVIAEREVTVRGSIGIALSDGKADAKELLCRADMAMYAAKRRGKRSYVVFEPHLRRESIGDLDLRPDLESALRLDQLRAVFQPIVDLATREVVAAEALIRWDHPQQGLIPPDRFLPVAEYAGIIFDLDLWMLEQACNELVAWRRSGLEGPFDVNVNLSGGSLQHPELVGRIFGVLASTGADPRDVVLELTESVLIRDVDVTVGKLRELKALGLRVAIDDFGTGYSSLAYLQRFPLDVIKIDKSFVDNVALGAEEASFAETIIALARQLGLSTVAEGVETSEQADALAKLGANTAQGYLFSRPVAAADMREVLGTRPIPEGLLIRAGA